MRKDDAASDVVGTILLVAVTVLLISGVALSLQQAATDAGRPTAPAAEIVVTGDSRSLTIAHVGREALDAHQTLVTVETAGGRRLVAENLTLRDLSPALGEFAFGQRITLSFDACETTDWCRGRPTDGEAVMVTLRSLAHRRDPVGSGTFIPVDGTQADLRPSFVATLPANGTSIWRGEIVHLSATIAARSPSSLQAVSVDLRPLGITEPVLLYDDGTNGDATAGDLVFERYLLVPPGPEGPARLRFAILTPDQLVTQAVVVQVNAARQDLEWLEITLDDDAPWPRKVSQFTPVFVNGTNLNMASNVMFRSSDGALQPAIWMQMPTRPPGKQLQLLAPANPTEVEQVFGIVVAGPFGEVATPGNLTVVPNAEAALYPAASLPNPVLANSSEPVELYPPVLTTITGYDEEGHATAGTASTAFAHVLVEGRDLDHLENVVLVGGGSTIAVMWAPIDAGKFRFITHPGIPPGSYDVVAANALYWGSKGPFVIPAPPVPAIESIQNLRPPHDAAGSSGDELLVSGTNLHVVTQVRLVGSVDSRGLLWWLNGTKLHTLVPPALPPGTYALNVSSPSGSSAATFEVVLPQPIITDVTPDRARDFMQVNVSGARMISVTSVTLRNATMGTIAVPWTILDDSRIAFFTYPGLLAGEYQIRLSTGLRSATASLVIEPAGVRPPSALSMAPTRVRADEMTAISGIDLGGVTRVTLNQTNQTRSIVTSWYLEQDQLRVLIPASAAPAGAWNITYRVELTGAFSGIVRVPEELTVLPPAAPQISRFSPSSGGPYTQINIYGAHFVNVHTVTLGEVPVYFSVINTTHLVAVTHGGIAPGNHSILVTTATGTATSSERYWALPMRLVPTYNASLIASFAVNITAVRTGQNDPIDPLHVKIRPQSGWSVTGVTFNPVNYLIQQSSATEAALTRDSTCTSGVSRWVLGTTPLAKYNAHANQLNYVFGVTLTNGTTTTTTYVFTNDQTRNFILPAGKLTDSILDHGFPTTGFMGCGA